MKNSLLFTALLLAIASSDVMAQTVSESEARDKALSFISQSHRARGNAADDIELAYTSATETETHYYVFNYGSEPGGFVIVGGDERTEEILGFGEHGPFDYDLAPDNLKWWLSQYDYVIHAQIEQNVKPAKFAPRRAPARANIEPLIKTHWGQRAPFYNAIPSLGPNYNRFLTGCVATAMAQVMYYHRWPKEHGSGSYSYTINYNGTMPVTFSADFGNTTYDWANMLAEYESGKYSTAQGNAVAELMYHAGVSVNMKYNSSASGASSSNIPNALCTYFGYDKSATRVERDNYSDEEWFEMLYGELAASRPVLYGGQDAYSDNGHEFICDGYKDGLYHFNWGWNGLYDEYFTVMGVDGLQPQGSGDGGAGDGASYTRMQDMIINVAPDHGGDYLYGLILRQQYGFRDGQNYSDEIIIAKGVKKTLTVDNIDILNPFPATIDFQLGVIIENTETGEQVSSCSNSYNYSLESNHYFTSTFSRTFSTSLLTNVGTYKVYPAYKRNGTDEWKKMMVPPSLNIPVLKIVDPESEGGMDISFGISAMEVRVGKTIQISYPSDYHGSVTYSSSDNNIATVDNTGKITGQSRGTVTITAKGTADGQYKATEKIFQISVTVLPVIIESYEITNKGYFTPSTVEIKAIILNQSGENLSNFSYQSVFSFTSNHLTIHRFGYVWQDQDTSNETFTLSESNAKNYIGKNGYFRIPSMEFELPITICEETTINPVITDVNWGTLCLPFDAAVPSGMTAYSVTGIDGNELILEKSEKLEMDVPYLVRGAGEYSFTGPDTTPWEDGVQDGCLMGNVAPSVYAPAGSYVLQQKNGRLGFYQVKEDNTQRIRQYSAYLSNMPAGPAVNAYYFNIDTEGIVQIESDETCDGVAYGITGQRVEASHKGLTVRNGKISFIK